MGQRGRLCGLSGSSWTSEGSQRVKRDFKVSKGVKRDVFGAVHNVYFVKYIFPRWDISTPKQPKVAIFDKTDFLGLIPPRGAG